MNKKLLVTLLVIFSSIQIIDSLYTINNYPLPTIQNQSDASCSSQQFPAWFFDGQKCEHCNPNCQSCSSYRGCSTCLDTYTKTNSTGTAANDTLINYCLPCNSVTGGYNQGIQTCCLFDNGDAKTITWSDDFDWVHALSCQTGYKLFGHYCYKISNCASYTQYGRCYTCSQGYYLNEQYTCSPCNFPAWSDRTVAPIMNLKNPPDVVLISQYVNNAYTTSQTLFKTNIQQFPNPNQYSFNQGCKDCNGYGECVNCFDGYWLGQNVFRTTYDLDIAQSPSFCKKCNFNCNCGINSNQKFNSCLSCIAIQDTDGSQYYFDSNINACFKCNDASNNGHFGCSACSVTYSSTNNVNNERVFLCTACQPGFKAVNLYDWNSTQYGVACIPCRYGHLYDFSSSSISGNTTLNTAMYYGNNQQFKQLNLQPNVNVTQKQYPFTIDYTTTTNAFTFKFSLKSALTQANNLQKYLNSIAADPNCQDCDIQTFIPVFQDPQGNTINYQRNTIYLTSCNQCDNGYERQFLNLSVTLQFLYANNTSASFPVNYNFTIYQCESCNLLLKQQYYSLLVQNTSSVSPQSMDSTYQGWRQIRRCKFQPSTYSYTVTQCGNNNYNAYPNNFYQDLNLNTNNTESFQRGPLYTYSKSSFVHDPASLQKLTYLFTPNVISNLGGYCLPNRYNCRTMDISIPYNLINSTNLYGNCSSCYESLNLLTGSYPNSNNNQKTALLYDSQNDFNRYFLSNENHCILCNSSICQQCNVYPLNKTNYLQDTLYCNLCVNGYDPMVWPTVQPTNDPSRTNYATSPIVNNAAKLDTNTQVDISACYSCTQGCLECSLVNNTVPICQTCQMGFRITNDTSPICKACLTPNCQDCSQSEVIGNCNICFPGYRLIVFGIQPNNTQYCEKCDSYCLDCSDNRKICKQCMPGYYLSNNYCQKRRVGCVTYDQTGKCTACAHSFRLINDWCLKCFQPFSGQSECPSACSQNNYTDVNTGINIKQLSDSQINFQEGKKILQLLEQEKINVPDQSALFKYTGILIIILLSIIM